MLRKTGKGGFNGKDKKEIDRYNKMIRDKLFPIDKDIQMN
jgi:hypothetical protein